ncbi:MAG: D-tyrosyl-tRNA(Tyr) deacylase [Chloroflexi bacterium]|nr:D-tyrosyl-tRNA(Tyr) deacylase [Chloroflexota bacterium]
MKAVLQRVTGASVEVAGEIIGKIGRGLVVFAGIARDDTEEDVDLLAQKIVELRLLPDATGKFNISAVDARCELLLVSQFTLLADTRKGRRPNFTDAAPAETAGPLFDRFVSLVKESGLTVATGRFQQHMLVNILNDGPVTILLDTRDWLPRKIPVPTGGNSITQ